MFLFQSVEKIKFPLKNRFLDFPLSLITSVRYTIHKLMWSFVLNIRPHGFYPFFRFNDIFCSWLLSIHEAFFARIPHGFSFGLRLGLNADHGSGFIPKSWNYIFIVAARWIGALSCWKIVFLSPLSVVKGNNLPCNIFWYPVAFDLIFTKTISPNVP